MVERGSKHTDREREREVAPQTQFEPRASAVRGTIVMLPSTPEPVLWSPTL